MLYPRESETREVKDLSGVWKFKVDKDNEGYGKQWFKKPLEDTIPMPVPASYNDITQDPEIRDHIGNVWYERNFFIPLSWEEKRIFLRVGSASHKARVWVNGREAGYHKGGFLPFAMEVNDLVQFGQKNRVTIAVNNILDWTDIPPGEIKEISDDMHPEGYRIQEYHFSFFNYSGIHRPVRLLSLPGNYIDDISVVTNIDGNSGIVSYAIKVEGRFAKISVCLLDKEGRAIAEVNQPEGRLCVSQAHLWEPDNPYLYILEVKGFNGQEKLEDSYRLPVGIRTIKVDGKQFLINGKPFYFKGFGKHEDSDLRGKGLDHVINIKDLNLLKWMRANSFRTSHYPYSEELMNLADREGFVIIDEVPAVGLNLWGTEKKAFSPERINEKTLEHHVNCLRELIGRDKNHPCVIMWSVANEPASHEQGALPYFQRIAKEVRNLDPTRPITLVNSSMPHTCRVAQLFDVVCVNRYYSWYTDSGHLELIEFQLEKDLRDWYEKFKKPVFLTEYGADTIAGFHQDPPIMFTEEYQCQMLERYHRVLDRLDFIIGEHVWNFADFATKQDIVRVVGNKKGVFTRQRQPKAAAFLLKRRWSSMKKKGREESK